MFRSTLSGYDKFGAEVFFEVGQDEVESRPACEVELVSPRVNGDGISCQCLFQFNSYDLVEEDGEVVLVGGENTTRAWVLRLGLSGSTFSAEDRAESSANRSEHECCRNGPGSDLTPMADDHASVGEEECQPFKAEGKRGDDLKLPDHPLRRCVQDRTSRAETSVLYG